MSKSAIQGAVSPPGSGGWPMPSSAASHLPSGSRGKPRAAAGTILSVEHEREGGREELEFQLRWVRS